MSDGGNRRTGGANDASTIAPGPVAGGPESSPRKRPDDPDDATGIGPVLARFDRPRAPTETLVAVVADAHCATRETGTWKCYHRTEVLLKRAVEDCNRVGVDAVVLAGDLTADGRPAEFNRVHDLLADLDPPAFAVPGNHDVPKSFDDHETPPPELFGRRFAPGRLPYHVEVGGLDLVGVDTATAPDGSLADGHGGRVGHEQRLWLDDVLGGTTTPVVFGHHNLCGDLKDVDPGTARSSYPLEDATSVLEVLSLHGVELYCSGHVHLPAVGRVAGVRELVAPPLSTFPQGYVVLAIGPDGTTVRYAPAAEPGELGEAYLAARDGSTLTRVTAAHAARQMCSLPLWTPGT